MYTLTGLGSENTVMQISRKKIIPIAIIVIVIIITVLVVRNENEPVTSPVVARHGDEIKYDASLNVPVFSHGSGFFAEDFYLTLSGVGANETIRFTLDGSVPTVDSPNFTSPILIHAPVPTWENSPMSLGARPGVLPRLYYNGMVVRARIFNANNEGSAIVTQSFFVERQVGDSTRGTFNMRVLSISIEPEYFGPEMGMYPMFNLDIRRMSYVEVFYPDGTPMLSQYAQLRVAGNWSRREQQKSLRLNFNQGDGIVDNIDLIPDTRQSFYSPLETVSTFRHATLRTADLHRTTIREALVDRVSEPLRPDNQNATPAVVFINGEFWGMFCMREHRGRTFIAASYPGISEQSVTMLDFSWNTRNSGDHSNCLSHDCHYARQPDNLLYPLNPCVYGIHANEGPFGPWVNAYGRLPREHPLFRVGFSEGRDEAMAYRSWMRTYNAIVGGRVYCDSCMEAVIIPEHCDKCLFGLDMSNNDHFEIAMQFVCMDNLIDFFIIYFHFDNWDWPGNNFITWKTDRIYSDIPVGDGKWRFVIHDFDNAIGYVGANNINLFTTPSTGRGAGTWDILDDARVPLYHDNQPAWAVTMWRKLFENELFRNTLAARYATYTGTVFNPNRVNHLINILQEERVADIGANFYRWNKLGGDLEQSVRNWALEINHLRNFSQYRARHALNHIRTYYNRTDRPNLGLNLPNGTTNINWSTDTTMGFFDIAGAEIRPDLFERDGMLFFNLNNFNANYLRGLPVEVTARPFDGYQFSHFEVSGASNKSMEYNRLTITPTENESIIQVVAVFELIP